MKRVGLIIGFIFATMFSFAKERSDTTYYFKTFFPETGFFVRPDSLPDGKWMAFCESDHSVIGIAITYKKGKRNGECLTYWPNGKLRSREFYVNGSSNDTKETWYENGVKQSENSRYSLEDIVRYSYPCKRLNLWTIDGKQVIKNGTGEFISYLSKGEARIEGKLLNGSRTGEWKWYDIYGKVYQIDHFENGKQHGSHVQYNVLSQIREVTEAGSYKNGKRTGEWEAWVYQSDGQRSKYTTTYKNGERNGESRSWYANGILNGRTYFEAGKKNGADSSWYENGQLRAVENYKMDKPDGEFIRWDQNGQMLSKGFLKNGKRIGQWTFWKEDGTFEKVDY